jgi:glycosyltransferase involved in cell wall biosynthesis
MVPPKDEQALATALIRLLSDKPLRQEMGDQGRLKVEEYSWQNIARRVAEYYASLLDGS